MSDQATTTTTTTTTANAEKSNASTSVLKQKYHALLESRNKDDTKLTTILDDVFDAKQYKEEAEELRRTVLALEKRVVALESELVSPSNPNHLAAELAETKGALDAVKEALRVEKNRAAKENGRANRVAKLARDREELEREIERSASRARVAFAVGVASGAVTCAACYTLFSRRAR